MRERRRGLRVTLGVLLATTLGLGGVLAPAQADPCTWGTQCMAVTMVAPATGATLSGTVLLEATARVTQPARGTIVKVEWWLYHPDFTRQVPENAEGKILLAEVTAPAAGTATDGTWRSSWVVADRMTARDGAYQLPGTRTYTLPNTAGYSIEAHVLDEEWVRTWGGPPGRSAPATVSLSFGTTSPPAPAADEVQIGTAVRKLAGTNIYRATGTLVRYTGTRSPANQYGIEVAVGSDNKVTAVSRFQPGMAIPAGGYVLSGHDDSADWLGANAPVGAVVQLGSGTTEPPPPSPPAANEVQVGAVNHVLNGTNVARQANYLVRYTGTASPANQWGFEAAVGSDGRVSALSDLKPGMAIPAGGYVLSGHDDSADWLRQHATVGATVTLPGGTTPTPTPTPPPTPCTGYVLLTFDDGPHPEFTPRILDELNRSGATATFFAVGQQVENHPDVAAQIVAGGHRLQNHTWDHPYLTTLSADEVTSQLMRTNTAIEEATGVAPTQWRPPYEDYSPATQAIATSLGLEMVLWNYETDTNDWRGGSPEEIRDVVLDNATDGSIVLMHDRIENTAAAVPMILDGLHQKGLCTR